jgi:N-acetylmuramoyl-L-alanine amidase
MAVGTDTIGEMIRRSGKTCLWEDRIGKTIDTVIIHYISASASIPHDPFNLAQILAIFPQYGVSSHYLITRDGTVLRLVPELKKAWHCGGSIMPPPDSRTGVNDFSIGIELAATESSGYTDIQYRNCALLSCEIEKRYGYATFTGHENIAGPGAVAMGLRTDVKTDPGALFRWDTFNELLHSMSCG